MPCWPDIWEQAKREQPIAEAWVALLAYMVSVVVLFRAPKAKTPRRKLIFRIIGGIAAAPLLIILPAFVFGEMLSSSNPPAKERTISSPSGNQATLIYHAGFLGRDDTEVRLKQIGCCRHTPVFWHSGSTEFQDPQVSWSDNHHLVINFHSREGDLSHCETMRGDIAITCTKLQWPQVPVENNRSSVAHEGKN